MSISAKARPGHAARRRPGPASQPAGRGVAGDDLAGLPNLGPKSIAMLAGAGIHTVRQLRAAGAVAAYAMVKRSTHHASLNLLWALAGGLSGLPWQQVAKQDRLSLLLALEDLKRGDGQVDPVAVRRRGRR